MPGWLRALLVVIAIWVLIAVFTKWSDDKGLSPNPTPSHSTVR